MSVVNLYVFLYWVWIATEILLQLVTPTLRRQGKVRDRGSLILLLATIFLSISAASWYGETHSHNIPGTRQSLIVVATTLLAAGLLVRWIAVLTLGASFSTNVAIHATQKLRTTGLYRWARHPSYTGMLIIFAAIGVRERNWVSLAIVLVFPMAALLYRIHVEERALTEAFGSDYAAYSRRTKRLIPGIY